MQAAVTMFRNTSDEKLRFAAGQVLFTEGDAGDRMYVVLSGQVDIIVGGKIIDTAGEGGIVGEMALLDASPRSATATARSDCEVVPITQKRFIFLIQQTPMFSIQVMRIMAERLRRMTHPQG